MGLPPGVAVTRLLPEHVHDYLRVLGEVSQTQSDNVAAMVAAPNAVTYKVVGDTYSIQNGRKYLRVVCTDEHGSRSVHAFIDKSNGNILKAAGWKSPQRDKDGLAVRANLADPKAREDLFNRLYADPQLIYGYYLYK